MPRRGRTALLRAAHGRLLPEPLLRAAQGALMHGAALLVSAGLAGACIVDDDDRCSTGQALLDGLCRCPPGETLVGRACVGGVMDAALDGAVPGEAGAASSDAGGLGVACEPASQPCLDPVFSSCQRAPSGERYCTSTGCQSASDCMQGYQCATAGSSRYCRRPYRGQDTPCTSSSMCSGDALFCSSLRRVCMVPDCTDGSCDPGYTCFKASQFMPNVPDVCVKSELLAP